MNEQRNEQTFKATSVWLTIYADLYFPSRSLTTRFPDFVPLKSLLAGLTLPRKEPSEPKESRPSSPETVLPVEPMRSTTPPLPANQLNPYKFRLSKQGPIDGQFLYGWMVPSYCYWYPMGTFHIFDLFLKLFAILCQIKPFTGKLVEIVKLKHKVV